jgi:hypothetical protein
MSVHHPKYADRRVRTPLDRDHKPTVGIMGSDWLSKTARWPGFTPPTIDQDRLTVVLLTTIMVLSALDFMLRFPALGAVIAQYNQF